MVILHNFPWRSSLVQEGEVSGIRGAYMFLTSAGLFPFSVRPWDLTHWPESSDLVFVVFILKYLCTFDNHIAHLSSLVALDGCSVRSHLFSPLLGLFHPKCLDNAALKIPDLNNIGNFLFFWCFSHFHLYWFYPIQWLFPPKRKNLWLSIMSRVTACLQLLKSTLNFCWYPRLLWITFMPIFWLRPCCQKVSCCPLLFLPSLVTWEHNNQKLTPNLFSPLNKLPSYKLGFITPSDCSWYEQTNQFPEEIT